jgi:hypothetical protein
VVSIPPAAGAPKDENVTQWLSTLSHFCEARRFYCGLRIVDFEFATSRDLRTRSAHCCRTKPETNVVVPNESERSDFQFAIQNPKLKRSTARWGSPRLPQTVLRGRIHQPGESRAQLLQLSLNHFKLNGKPASDLEVMGDDDQNASLPLVYVDEE